MYRLYQRPKTKVRRILLWGALIAAIFCLIPIGVNRIADLLKPNVVIKQSNGVTTAVDYNNPSKIYNEPGFSITLPTSWSLLPQVKSEYQMYSWQSPDRGTDGQVITVFEDTLPLNLAVNRVQVVQGESDQLALDGTVSDNCTSFTKTPPEPNSPGAPAEWSGINFICDQSNPERDVVGTSSADGVNTVILKDPSSGVSHKFFFTFTDDSINPDFTVFYNALLSVRAE